MKTDKHSVDFNKILSFDLELTRDEKLRHMGAVLAERTLSLKINQDEAIHQLDEMAGDADLILGHNILDHDLPWIAKQRVRAQILLDKPIIDTLYLSPLAFPANPYHRLIKDYKLVRDSINDPVNDAKLSLQVFTEQICALQESRWLSCSYISIFLSTALPAISVHVGWPAFFPH